MDATIRGRARVSIVMTGKWSGATGAMVMTFVTIRTARNAES